MLVNMLAVIAVAVVLAVGLPAWASEAGPDPDRALKKVDALFDGYFAWFGSLYDRHSGGVYYSPVTRARPHAYPPHIEATSKYTRVIEWSGLVDEVPPVVKRGIVGFIQRKQIAEADHAYRGFFLDPHYRDLDPAEDGATVSGKRAARAVGFSTGILELFGAEPLHRLPSVEGNTGPLAHLRSPEAFRTWLENRRWTRSWTAGGDLLVQAAYIRDLPEPKRTALLETAWDYLETVQQNPATGCWGNHAEGDNTHPYILLNGAHKIVLFYTRFDRPVPHAETLMDTALAEVREQAPTNLLYIYNSSQLVNNLRQGSGATISPAEVAAFVTRQAANLARFRREDGGFTSHLSGRGAFIFQPATDAPVSNTDVSGLALKARNRLHDLVRGSHDPLPKAHDPRLFGMSGANSTVLGTFPAGDRRAFTFTPDGPTDLYFLALTAAHDGTDGRHATIVVSYRVGDSGPVVEAGRTTVSATPTTRDIPLLTRPDLQGLARPVTFGIQQQDADKGRVIRIERIELHGVSTR